MIINQKIFSFPPYISTSWNNIQSFHLKGSALVITLASGETVNIPGLKQDVIDLIFAAHAAYLEQDNSTIKVQPHPRNLRLEKSALLFSIDETDLPSKLGLSNLEALNSTMQHNQALANAPDLPKEILQKIGSIAKIVAPDDSVIVPKPEPHCNCPHCQIARAIQESLHPAASSQTVEEEEISDRELQFQQWEIIQTGDKLFSVTNRLDRLEQYNVYLGEPVGCTCGKPGCEHLLAVLKS